MTVSKPKVTCFHDGECPICAIEINAMKKLDKTGNVKWVDIAQDKTALATAGLTYQQAMEHMYVIDENQQLQSGVLGFFTAMETTALLPAHCSNYRKHSFATASHGVLLRYIRTLSFAVYR